MGYLVGYIVMSLMIFAVYKLYYVYEYGYMADKKDYLHINTSIFVSLWVTFFGMSYFATHMVIAVFLVGLFVSIASLVIRIRWAKKEYIDSIQQ